MLRLCGLLPLTISLVLSLFTAHAATLRGVTSKPDYSVFIRGEQVKLSFTAEGLKPNEAGLSLAVTVADADGRALLTKQLPVTADANGKWTGELVAPSEAFGCYHVTARLSTGEELPAVGTRAAGYLSYLVVIDPKQRVQPGEEAHFGMQGGFATCFDGRPYLGVHWVLAGYSWGREEPERPGQFAERRAALRKAGGPFNPTWEAERKLGLLPLPTLLNGTPKWAVQGGQLVYTTGIITNLDAWRGYCREVGRAAREDYPELKHHVYQITWEPVYPWGFPGSDEDLIRAYQVAYPALHATDPTAVVIGPTGAGISAGDVAWNERLLKKGIGKYLDAYSIHPYIAQPPETHNLVANVRALKEMIRTYVGRDLDLYGTEQGFATGGDQAKEKLQAMWLTRSYLIMLGERFKVNTAFYFADYPGEPGYGFFHNLVIEKIPWGPNSVSPKPIAGAFAALTMLLEGHKSCGAIEWLGPTALGYAYERQGQVTLALWDWGEKPRTVKLPVGVKTVELLDWMGNGKKLATPAESLEIALGPEPQYVRGVSPALWGSGARRPLVLEPHSVAALPGDKVRLVARVSAPAKAALSASLRVALPPAWDRPSPETRIELKPGQEKALLVEFTVPTEADFGAVPLQATVGATGRSPLLVGFATTMLRVREPMTVTRLQPTGAAALSLTIRNTRSAATEGVARIRSHGVPDGAREVPFSLPPGGEKIVTADLTAASPEPGRVYQARVTLADKSGATVTGTHPVTFTAAPRLPRPPTVDGDLADWAGTPPISLKGREWVVRQPQLYHGATDLSARVRWAWDDSALYLAADVTDDAFLQDQEGFNTWKQDSVQIAFDPEPGKAKESTGNLLAEAGTRTNSEIDLALTKNGPEAYRTIAPSRGDRPVAPTIGLLTREQVPLAIVKRAGGVVYEAAFPWATLGAAGPPAHRVLGLALTVNDADDPKQPEPKAIGLFGGITPVKDPTQLGQVVLSDSPSAPKPAGPRLLRLSGFLGQSQPPGEPPVPWTGCVGAMTDAKGSLWTVVGDRAYRFEADRLRETVALPNGMRLARGDDRTLLCVSHDDKVYRFDAETKQTASLGEARWADGKGPREIALGPDGSYCALGQDGTVRGWNADGGTQGQLLALKAGKDWWYCALGVDPATRELVVGSYWPDCKLYRCDRGATGPKEVTEGASALLTVLDGALWLMGTDGSARPVSATRGGRCPVSGDWAYYPTGLAPAADGGAWVACAQGLLHFDRKGKPAEQRLGGLGDPSLVAAGANGTVLALVENSQRFARMFADDAPDAPLSSNANEPWRVANGWTSRAAGMGWDGAGYAILDAVKKCLWRFDPDHTAWAEKPWIRLTKENAFENPRLLAVGDARAHVLDGEKLTTISLADPESVGTTDLRADVKPADIVALAADGDERLYVATATRVVALDPEGRERWAASEGLRGVCSLAASDGALIVADRAGKTLTVLDAASGAVAARLDGSTIPGGFDPTGVTARGSWVFVADAAGHRVLRLKLE